jgi:hypothetical protein
MNGWSRKTFEVDIQFRVPGTAERDQEVEFAKEMNLLIPHASFATFQYALVENDEDNQKKELWLVDCWLPEQTFNELYESVMKEQLCSLTVGVSGELLYIDHGYDPAGKWTSWFLRSDRPDSGYSRGSVVDLAFVTGGFGKKAAETATEKRSADPVPPDQAAAPEATYARQIERAAMALESAQATLGQATSTIRWVVAALGLVALVLLLK